MAQNFNKDEIKITMKNQELNIYKMIQDAREDTEIYPTLEKYGSIERMVMKTPDVYQDLREIKDLRSSMDQVKEATKLWENLPLNVRKEFGHSQKEFMEKGENWLKNKIDQQYKIEEEMKKPIVNTEKTEVQNG